MTTKITNDNITSIDAGKLTGSLPAGMAPETDLSSVRSDILKLALHQAIDGNRVAYNLEDSFVDGFEDDTGITTETTVDRNASEYVSSSVITEGTPTQLTLTTGMLSVNSELPGTIANVINGSLSNYGVYGLENTLPTANGILTVDYGSAVTWEYFRWYNFRTNGRMKGHKIQTSTDNATWTDQTTTLSETTTSSSSILHDAISANGWNRNTLDTPTSARYIRIVYSSGYNEGDTACGVAEIQAYQKVFNTVHNATGTLISDPQTASSSRTSASGVIIYEDAEGTNTLGTDLKIYFSCNNSAWTEASSYGTPQTYSGNKKLVKLGATTCTAGTSVAMKAEWANQSVGTSGNQVPEMTSNTAPTGVASADNNNANAYKLFDNNSTSVWTGSPTTGQSHAVHYYTYDFGSGNDITATSYNLSGNQNSGSGSNQNPNSWTFQASNDNSTWTTLDTQSGQAGTFPASSYSTNTYTFSNATSYRYYRWGWTGAGTVAHQEVQLSNAEIIGTGTDGKEARLHGWAVNY